MSFRIPQDIFGPNDDFRDILPANKATVTKNKRACVPNNWHENNSPFSHQDYDGYDNDDDDWRPY
jgi:hypothetical protein